MKNHLVLVLAASFLICGPMAKGADAPSWMHALVNAPLPAHDEKTDAVLMYSETNVTVLSVDKMKTTERRAYKILRPGGRDEGMAVAFFDAHSKITNFHGWSIPAQ